MYISLVGTSILRNACRDHSIKSKWSQQYPDIENWHSLPLIDPRNNYPDGEICRIGEENPLLYHDLLNIAKKLENKASAEIAGILGIARSRGHSLDDVEILLIPTKTCTSKLSAELNNQLLVEKGFQKVHMEYVSGFSSPDTFEEGLTELLDIVVSRMARAKKEGKRIFVNAMAGFKAESTFMVIASFLAGADGVIYMHETFHEPIYLPAIPIEIEHSIIELFRTSGFRIPIEVWSSLDVATRRRLQESGLIQHKGEFYELRPWIRVLVEKLSAKVK